MKAKSHKGQFCDLLKYFILLKWSVITMCIWTLYLLLKGLWAHLLHIPFQLRDFNVVYMEYGWYINLTFSMYISLKATVCHAMGLSHGFLLRLLYVLPTVGTIGPCLHCSLILNLFSRLPLSCLNNIFHGCSFVDK